VLCLATIPFVMVPDRGIRLSGWFPVSERLGFVLVDGCGYHGFIACFVINISDLIV
jgi:hypothetical protein